MLLAVLISLWGVRLCLHILKRNTGKPEDFRYKKFRKDWGKWVVPRAFLQVYMLQGVFMFIISLPVILKPQDSFARQPAAAADRTCDICPSVCCLK